MTEPKDQKTLGPPVGLEPKSLPPVDTRAMSVPRAAPSFMSFSNSRGLRFAVDTTDYDESQAIEDQMPEKRLLIAIVQRALYDYAYPVPGKAHLQYDAAAWLFNPTSHGLMSLHWICTILSEDPEHLKKRIQKAAKSKIFKGNSVIFRVDTR